MNVSDILALAAQRNADSQSKLEKLSHAPAIQKALVVEEEKLDELQVVQGEELHALDEKTQHLMKQAVEANTDIKRYERQLVLERMKTEEMLAQLAGRKKQLLELLRKAEEGMGFSLQQWGIE